LRADFSRKGLDVSYSIKFDAQCDVLYVKQKGAKIEYSIPVKDDDSVYLNIDCFNRVIGLQMIDASQITADKWVEHFNTGEMPQAMFEIIAKWLKARVML
jgi:uncharacterized protein YuzE